MLLVMKIENIVHCWNDFTQIVLTCMFLDWGELRQNWKVSRTKTQPYDMQMRIKRKWLQKFKTG